MGERPPVAVRGVSVVETGPAERVFAQPAHPYTRSLLASVPQLHHKWGRTGRVVPERAGEGG